MHHSNKEIDASQSKRYATLRLGTLLIPICHLSDVLLAQPDKIFEESKTCFFICQDGLDYQIQSTEELDAVRLKLPLLPCFYLYDSERMRSVSKNYSAMWTRLIRPCLTQSVSGSNHQTTETSMARCERHTIIYLPLLMLTSFCSRCCCYVWV